MLAVPFMQQSCVGDDNAALDASSDGTTGDSGSDGAKNDGATDGGPTCTPGCIDDASTFRDCDGSVAINTACSFGCLASPSVHCGVFNPTGLVEPSDFQVAGLGDFDPCAADAGSGFNGCSFVLHTDTGKIDDGGTNVLRPMNASPTAVEVGNGIAFHVASYDGGAEHLAIFAFKNLNLRGGELHFTGPNPVAIVAQQDILVAGLVDMFDTQFFGQCVATAGGGAAGGTGASSTSLGGGGAGSGASYVTGGGGGGSGGAGGTGGQANLTAGGTAGGAFTEGFNPLRGGGGGGGAGTGGGPGGAGGGAIALFANGTITITQGGGGPLWGVNAGGCGSAPAFSGPSNGGAGAGGAILVEGHAVVGFGSTAGLAANGGGGGGNGVGTRAAITNTPTAGIPSAISSPYCYGAGGNGGAGTTQATIGSPASCSTAYGGGGGGGLGRIEIGSYAPLTVDGGFIISPPQTNIAVPVE